MSSPSIASFFNSLGTAPIAPHETLDSEDLTTADLGAIYDRVGAASAKILCEKIIVQFAQKDLAANEIDVCPAAFKIIDIAGKMKMRYWSVEDRESLTEAIYRIYKQTPKIATLAEVLRTRTLKKYKEIEKKLLGSLLQVEYDLVRIESDVAQIGSHEEVFIQSFRKASRESTETNSHRDQAIYLSHLCLEKLDKLPVRYKILYPRNIKRHFQALKRAILKDRTDYDRLVCTMLKECCLFPQYREKLTILGISSVEECIAEFTKYTHVAEAQSRLRSPRPLREKLLSLL